MLLQASPMGGRALVMLLVFGLVIYMVERFVRRIRRMHKVRAKVLRFEVSRVGDSMGAFPVFEVVGGPFAGEVGKSNLSFNFMVLRMGDEVDAFYSPEKARILSRKGLQWMAVFFAGFTLIILVIASIYGMGQFVEWVTTR